MLLWLRVFVIIYVQILAKANIENTVSVFWNVIVIGIKHFQINIISCVIKQLHESTNCCGMSFGKHTRYILGNKEQRLSVTQDSDIFIEQLSTSILYTLQRTSFTPRLTWRTANYACYMVRKSI